MNLGTCDRIKQELVEVRAWTGNANGVLSLEDERFLVRELQLKLSQMRELRQGVRGKVTK